jgi:hypothetical protein
MDFSERLQEIEQTARRIGRGNAAKDARAFQAIKASALALITDVQTVYTSGASAIIRAAGAEDKAGVLSGIGLIKGTIQTAARLNAERRARHTAAIMPLYERIVKRG